MSRFIKLLFANSSSSPVHDKDTHSAKRRPRRTRRSTTHGGGGISRRSDRSVQYADSFIFLPNEVPDIFPPSSSPPPPAVPPRGRAQTTTDLLLTSTGSSNPPLSPNANSGTAAVVTNNRLSALIKGRQGVEDASSFSPSPRDKSSFNIEPLYHRISHSNIDTPTSTALHRTLSCHSLGRSLECPTNPCLYYSQEELDSSGLYLLAAANIYT